MYCIVCIVVYSLCIVVCVLYYIMYYTVQGNAEAVSAFAQCVCRLFLREPCCHGNAHQRVPGQAGVKEASAQRPAHMAGGPPIR